MSTTNRRGLCRLCYCEITLAKTIDIFNEFNLKLNYVDVIKKYLYLNIAKCDGQPNTICVMCTKQLDQIHKFYSMIHDIQLSILKERDYAKILLISRSRTPKYYSAEPSKERNEKIIDKPSISGSQTNTQTISSLIDNNIYDDIIGTAADPKVINHIIDDAASAADQKDAEEQKVEVIIEIITADEDPLIEPKLELLEPLLDETQKSTVKSKRKKNSNNNNKNKKNNKTLMEPKQKVRKPDDKKPTKKGISEQSKKQPTDKFPLTALKIRNLPCTLLNENDENNQSENELSLRDSDNDEWPSQATLNEFPKSILYNGTLLIRRRALMALICKFYNLQCGLCDTNITIRYKNLHSLFQHYSDTHDTKGYVKCCQKKMFYYTGMVMHMARHIQPEAFRCNECGYMVTRPSFLASHKQTHLAEALRPFGCDKCSKRFCWKGALRIHMISHQPVNERKHFVCNVCGKKYETPGGLSTHKRATHSNKKKVIESHVCHICAKIFSTRTSLNEHMELHEPRENNQLQCQICGKWLMNKRCLKTHMHIHSDKVFNCNDCEYLTKKQVLLKRHILTHHTNSKPFDCELCGRSFKLKRALTLHVGLHNKPRVYICEFCERVFNSSTNYYTHRKQYHPTELQEVRDLIQLAQRQKRIDAGIESTDQDYSRASTNTTIVDICDVNDDDDGGVGVGFEELSEIVDNIQNNEHNDNDDDDDDDDKELIEIIEMQS